MSWYIDRATIRAGEMASEPIPAQDRTFVAIESDIPVKVKIYGRIAHESFRPIGTQDGPPNTELDLHDGIAVMSMAAIQGLAEIQFRIDHPAETDTNFTMSIRTFPND